MSTKKSVIISDHALAIMQACTDKRNPDQAIAWSNLVNRAIIVNDFLFRESLPTLTTDEWQLILNCYAGTCGSIEHPPYRIASDMMDDMGLLDIEQHPHKEFVKKVHRMSQAEQFAILSFVERFWNNDWNHAESFAEIVETISSAGGIDRVNK